MLWSGGKDSAMALYEAQNHGYRVRCLVTFAPPKPNFLAHPLSVIKMQSQALEQPNYILSVNAPFERSYEAALRWLKDEMGIGCVVTGDIVEVGGYPNWIGEPSRAVGMDVHAPLWSRNRTILLQQLVNRNFKTCVSCINARWLNENWVGRELGGPAIAELATISARTGLDLCGEEGEYHTLVTDGPPFMQQVDIRSYSKCTTGSLAYMDIKDMSLINRAAA
jgi:uncharacterized protein (TIGR00290 family)